MTHEEKILERQRQLKELKEKLINGEVPTVKGNIDTDYEFLEHEKHLYHIRLTQKINIEAEERYKEITRVIKISTREYQKRQSQSDNLKKGLNPWLGFKEVTILHDPVKMEKNEATKAKAKRAPKKPKNAETTEKQK